MLQFTELQLLMLLANNVSCFHVFFFVLFLFAENRGFIYTQLNTGGINPDDPDNPVDNKDHSMMVFFRDRVAPLVNNGWMKALILLTFAVYLGGALYGITQIKEGLERRKLSKEDSYSVKFFDLEDEYYREFPYRVQVILTGDLYYSDTNTQGRIEHLIGTLENTSYVTSSLYTESWLRSFLSFVDRNSEFLNITIDTEQEFIDALKEVCSRSTDDDKFDQFRK